MNSDREPADTGIETYNALMEGVESMTRDQLIELLSQAVEERDRLLKLVESAYVEGWQDAHTQKATHGPMSVTTPWEVSETRRALTERSNEE